MTKDNLVTVPVGTTLEEAERLLQRHRIEKLPVVDKDFHLKGLITVKDIQKKLEYPQATKDEQGRLRVGAAIGATGDFLERAVELARTKVDLLGIDTAHGHSTRVMEAIREVKRRLPEMQLVAGNVATYEGTRDLISLGVDGVKIGIGPGSICTTRVVTGAGVPQITAILEATRAAKDTGVPLIADGGIKYSGDISKAIAAGASVVMIGGFFAGTEEAPGETILYRGEPSNPTAAWARFRPWKRVPRTATRRKPPTAANQFRRVWRAGCHSRDRSGLGGSTGRRVAQWHGVLWRRKFEGIAGAQPFRAHHLGGLAREPRARRHHHARSAELPGRIGFGNVTLLAVGSGCLVGLPDLLAFHRHIFREAHLAGPGSIFPMAIPPCQPSNTRIAALHRSQMRACPGVFRVRLAGVSSCTRPSPWMDCAVGGGNPHRLRYFCRGRRISPILRTQQDSVALGCGARYLRGGCRGFPDLVAREEAADKKPALE